jgi:hypothetical protein
LRTFWRVLIASCGGSWIMGAMVAIGVVGLIIFKEGIVSRVARRY